MKSRVIFGAVVLTALAGAPIARADEHPGQKIYREARCTTCHGETGDADTPAGKRLEARKLASEEVRKMTDAQLSASIAKGKQKMPAFGTALSDGQIANVIAWVRTLDVAKP